jgi:hypothetical protein
MSKNYNRQDDPPSLPSRDMQDYVNSTIAAVRACNRIRWCAVTNVTDFLGTTQNRRWWMLKIMDSRVSRRRVKRIGPHHTQVFLANKF